MDPIEELRLIGSTRIAMEALEAIAMLDAACPLAAEMAIGALREMAQEFTEASA
jgi:hypothetical protein